MRAQAGERGDAAARRRHLIATLVVAAIGAVCASFGAASIWLADALPSGAHVVAGWLFAAYFWFLAAFELSPWGHSPRHAPKVAAYICTATIMACIFIATGLWKIAGLSGQWDFNVLLVFPYLAAAVLRMGLDLRDNIRLWNAYEDIAEDR